MRLPDSMLANMDQVELFTLCLKRLKTIDIVALATGLENKSRNRAMEFCIAETGTIYMLTEGGKKVRDILLNPEVSLAAWNQDENHSLWGLSINGQADIADMGDSTRFPGYYDTYSNLIKRKMPNREELPPGMKVIRIVPTSMELFDPMLPENGYASKQLWRR